MPSDLLEHSADCDRPSQSLSNYILSYNIQYFSQFAIDWNTQVSPIEGVVRKDNKQLGPQGEMALKGSYYDRVAESSICVGYLGHTCERRRVTKVCTHFTLQRGD